MHEQLRDLPSINKILEEDYIKEYFVKYKKDYIKIIIQEVINEFRIKILNGNIYDNLLKQINISIRTRLSKDFDSLKPVINATGVIIHTNLGRGPLSERIIKKTMKIGSNYSNLEYDLETGKRDSRDFRVNSLIKSLTGFEDAIVVNNNAAAVFLSLSTFSKGKNVLISRGELVEIGGNFRIPDICDASGAILKEIGTTNRTHEFDYIDNINENTGAIMKVNTSNYEINGFTSEVDIKRIVDISAQKNIPLIYDLGSGILIDIFNDLGEKKISNIARDNVPIVTFSGDKLIGGSQCGIIAGKKEYINLIKKNPIYRIVRIDKINLKVLEETLKVYLKNENIEDYIPIYEMINMPIEKTKKKCEYILSYIKNIKTFNTSIIKSEAVIGGGALPNKSLETFCVRIKSNKDTLNRLNYLLRTSEVPIILIQKKESLIINPRTLLKGQLDILIKELLDKMERF